MPDRALQLPKIARQIARLRGSSLVVLEITETAPGVLLCEDCASLDESPGRKPMLFALVTALRAMLARAEKALADEP